MCMYIYILELYDSLLAFAFREYSTRRAWTPSAVMVLSSTDLLQLWETGLFPQRGRISCASRQLVLRC